MTAADLEAAARRRRREPARVEPPVRGRFPDRVEAVEFWPVAADAAAVEREVMNLVTRLLGGRTDVVIPTRRRGRSHRRRC